MAINLVLSLEVPEEDLIKRLLGRGETTGRSDDNMEVVTKRIKEYHAKTKPVAGYYAKQGKLEHVNGEKPVEETFKLLAKNIERYIQPA